LALSGEGLRRDAKGFVTPRRDLPLIFRCWEKTA
jgi:hypothetical protein